MKFRRPTYIELLSMLNILANILLLLVFFIISAKSLSIFKVIKMSMHLDTVLLLMLCMCMVSFAILIYLIECINKIWEKNCEI